jgi:hypothetical protein
LRLKLVRFAVILLCLDHETSLNRFEDSTRIAWKCFLVSIDACVLSYDLVLSGGTIEGVLVGSHLVDRVHSKALQPIVSAFCIAEHGGTVVVLQDLRCSVSFDFVLFGGDSENLGRSPHHPETSIIGRPADAF